MPECRLGRLDSGSESNAEYRLAAVLTHDPASATSDAPAGQKGFGWALLFGAAAAVGPGAVIAGAAALLAEGVVVVEQAAPEIRTVASEMGTEIASEATAELSTLTADASALESSLSRLGSTLGEAMTTLFRGVMPEELASIERTDQFINLGSAEGKYFSLSAEGVSSYARQAVQAFGDKPYTMVTTQIPTSLLSPQMFMSVDRGVPVLVIPDALLPGLTPTIQPFMVIPLPLP